MLSLLFVLACGEDNAGGPEATSSGPEWSEAVEWEVQTRACPAQENEWVTLALPDELSLFQLEKCAEDCKFLAPADWRRIGTELEVECPGGWELRLLTLSPSD